MDDYLKQYSKHYVFHGLEDIRKGETSIYSFPYNVKKKKRLIPERRCYCS